VLLAQQYARQDRKTRGAIRTWVSKVTGRSMPQVTRLIRAYRKTGKVEAQQYRRRRFPRTYTSQDVVLLAEVDRARQRLSGPPTRHILRREYEQFGKKDFVRGAFR